MLVNNRKSKAKRLVKGKKVQEEELDLSVNLNHSSSDYILVVI
jgi:hypothetical protein